jgi:AsmA protein
MHIRLFIAAALVGAGAITTAALTPWTLGEGAAGAPLAQQLTALTGLGVKGHGSIRFTALPLPQLVVDRVQLADAAGKVTVETDSLRATLRLLPLVTGRIELTEVALGRPVFNTGDFDESDLTGLLARLFGEGPETSPDLRRLKILEGEVGLIGPDGLRTVLFGNVDAVFTRARLSRDIEASATFSWRGERVEAEASADPAAILHDGASGPLSLKLKSDRADMALNGAVAGGSKPQVNGALTLKSPDLRGAADWLGFRLPLPLAGPLDVSGTARIQPSTFELANARIELSGGQFDGVFSAKVQDGALAIGGTIATDQLNLTDAMRPLSPGRSDDGGWSRDPIPGQALPHGDVDLRISAARLTIGNALLENAAFSVMAHAGRIDLALGDSDFSKGTLRGRATAVANGEGGFDVKLQGGLERADLATALPAFGLGKKVTGTVTASFAVEGSGDNPSALFRSLAGKASATLKQGEVVGVNVPELLKRIERKPLLAAFDARGGRTPYSTVSLNGKIDRGVLDLTEAVLVSPATKVTATGGIGLGDRSFDIRGTAQAVGAQVSAVEPTSLPFELTGTFDEPLLLPDAKSLIRRSGAAAPFFGERPVLAEPPVASGTTPASAPLPQ